MREQPTDWHKIIADRHSRLRHNNIIWILAQIREQFRRQLDEASRNWTNVTDFQTTIQIANLISRNSEMILITRRKEWWDFQFYC